MMACFLEKPEDESRDKLKEINNRMMDKENSREILDALAKSKGKRMKEKEMIKLKGE